MSRSQSLAPRHLPLRSVLYNLAVLAVIAAAVGIGAGYVVEGLRDRLKPPVQEADTTVKANKTVAGQSLTPPVSWLRDPALQADGFAEKLDLVVPVSFLSDGALANFDVTLLSSTRARMSAYLLDTVYLHRFAATQLSGPAGLVGKPMTGGDGYDGETVWYDPLGADPFVAKCSPPVTADVAPRCVRTIALSGELAAVISFDARLLSRWREMDAALQKPLALIGTGLKR